MIYKKQTSISGAWLKGSEAKPGTKCKIVSEAVDQPSGFQKKDGSPGVQTVCKLRVQGVEDTLNVNLNRPTVYGLIEAFGEDSKGWQGHTLTIDTEKVKVAGKTVVGLYLIPEGFEKVDDEAGYTVIQKKQLGGTLKAGATNGPNAVDKSFFEEPEEFVPAPYEPDTIDSSDIPF